MPERRPGGRLAYGPDAGDDFASDHAWGLAVSFGLRQLRSRYAVITFKLVVADDSDEAQGYQRPDGYAHVAYKRDRLALAAGIGGPQMRSLPRFVEALFGWPRGTVEFVAEIEIGEGTA